jgi:hypothetical protein
LAEPTGQLAGQELHHARQVEPLRDIIHGTSRRSAAQTFDAGHEAQEFENRHVIIERRFLRHVTDRAADRERIGDDVKTGYFDAAGGGHKIARQHAKDRALARSIGSEQADDLARFNGKGNVGHGAARPIPLGHMLCQHNGGHQDSQKATS